MSDRLKGAVRDLYGATARASEDVDADGAAKVAAAFGYSAAELDALPEEANLGLSCGNPTAMATLRPGETVVDLGSGGGIDVFLAAEAVGPTGKAIGIDMTEDMVALARKNADKTGVANVEFHLAEIEKTPLADNSVDCIISNCVLNLCPDKPAAFREIFRILKPGGRLAVSDIALKQALPPALKESLDAYVGCIGGAISFEAYETGLAAAGFQAVKIIDANADLNVYGEIDGQAGCCAPAAQTSCCEPAPASASAHESLAETVKSHDLNAFAASVKVFAVKA
ncbi:MAG: arsenite methyltransferase [Pseudomonadota bacterium]